MHARDPGVPDHLLVYCHLLLVVDELLSASDLDRSLVILHLAIDNIPNDVQECTSLYGCCLDGVTPMRGPGGAGCPATTAATVTTTTTPVLYDVCVGLYTDPVSADVIVDRS